VTLDLSPSLPPSSSHTSADADAAAQQLLAESRRPARNPPVSSAVLGASLLNAARIDHRHSSPPDMARRNGAGKLRRVTIVPEGPRQDLARRRNLYDIELSPEKGNYTLPEKVNHKPLKLAHKKTLPQVRIPVRRSAEQQTDKEAAREVVDVRSQHDDLPQTTQAEELDSAPAGKRTRSRKQAAEKDQPIQQQQQTKKSKGKKALKASKQAAADEAPVQALEAEEPYAEAQDPDTAQAEESDSAPADTRTRPRRQATDNDQSARQDQPSKQGRARKASKHPKQATAEEASVEELEDEQSDAEAQERSAKEVEDSEGTVATPGTIEAVFDFLELDKRPGRCQTKLGIDIRRICKESCTQLEDEDESLATIMEDLQNLRSALNGIGSSVEEDDRRAFKGDAYVYIFRALTQYLQALYGWLEAKYAPVTQSLEAMRILSPLIHEILAFKSTIAKWDISIPQRYKGDRIIKDVETGLIVHLRQVDKTFSVRLSRLENMERDRVQQERFMRQMEEKEEEARRRKEAADSRNKRRARWQDLHIARKLCEPPGDRRDKLNFTWPEDLEKDANGVPFERLAVFKARSIPPQHRASDLAEEPEWTEDQESALLKGLEVFTGESHALLAYMRPTLMMNIGPRVFEQIFNEYCRTRPNDHARGRGGKLRDFSVTEITAKAAWYRSTLLKLYQDNNWMVADWIINIPVLP
jgi:chemotaxis protein histidine kinase CheA